MLRLILITILLLSSLLCVIRPGAYYLWYVCILVTEFAWIFAGIVVLLLLSYCIPGKYQTAGLIMGSAALLLYLSPIVRAYIVAGQVNNDFKQAFGSIKNTRKPFSFSKTFAVGAKEVPYQTYTYSNTNGLQLKLDYYAALTKGDAPCVIVIHGGSWSGGDSKQLPELNSHLARLGYNVAAINYTLVPNGCFPAPIHDVDAAINFLKAQASQLHIDTNKFVLLGRSAGGQIALVSAYTLQQAGIKGAISYYGPADLVWGYANPASLLVFNSCKILSDYIGGTDKELPQQYINSSATHIVQTGAVPTLMIYGKLDALVAYEHSTRLSKVLREKHVPHYLLTLPWATHGCDYTLKGPSGQLATYTVERFLEQVVQ